MTQTESTDAILAAVSAPVPFFRVLLVAGAGMWGAVRWAYVDQLDKAKKYRNQFREDRERFKDHRRELIDENQIKMGRTAELVNEKALLSQEGKNALEELADSQKRTDKTLKELGDDRLETNLDAGSASSEDEGAGERRVDRRQRKIERQKARRAPFVRRLLAGGAVFVLRLLAVGAVMYCAVKWREAPDQISKVSRAPVPFFLALLAVGAVMWGIVKWVYETQIRQAKLDIDWARFEIERFKRLQDDLVSENQTREQEIAQLENEEGLSQAGKNALEELADSQKRTDKTLEKLDETTDQLESNLDAGSASTGGLLEPLS